MGAGIGRRARPYRSVSTVVLAAMPAASVATAVSVKPGLRASVRSALRRAFMRAPLSDRDGCDWFKQVACHEANSSSPDISAGYFATAYVAVFVRGTSRRAGGRPPHPYPWTH